MSLKRTLHRKRQRLQSESDWTSFPPPTTDTTFDIPEEFKLTILYDSGSGNDRLIVMSHHELGLLDGFVRAKLWLADGTFKIVASIFFSVVHDTF